jgi:4-amino-4-deoxy-L-arabinose transferase-like glycosyltransferase
MNAVDSDAPPLTQHQPVRAGRESLVWILALVPFLALALWRLRDGPGLNADDYGQYLMHAQALAEGRPYTDIGYIYSPFRWGIGPAAAPPGLPLTLAVIYKLLGPNIIVMRLVMLCFATVFVLIAGLYFAQHQDRHIGLGVALLCALSPAIVHSSTQLLTDLPLRHSRGS